jgi:hypothetical protein
MQRNEGSDGESKEERVNRELIELLNELRVALPGVQVLFAFLLVVPFSNGFPDMTALQRDTYFAAFLATAASTALLIAPSAYHRMQFRTQEKERMLFTSNRLAIAGTVFLALAIGLVSFLVTDVLFKAAAASIVAAATAGWFGWFWYGLPLSRGRKGRQA